MDRITRDTVLDTAMRLVMESGIENLSMRKLAAELGVAVTSIYWHVGNRDVLVDQLVDRVIADMGAISVDGSTPVERVVSIARSCRRMILERPHLVGLVRERGLESLMMLPARKALVREMTAAGLRGARAGEAVQAVQYQIAGFVMLERALENSAAEPPAVDHWRGELALEDPELAASLSNVTDGDRLFVLSVRALVESLLG
ncbi:TetR/AcrR family transcriptional regulator [Embleya scabrispora]|uniref:TetR/AcrR family transcriptional regulator n=1 Tax=Embleya scabrispora TaxID=159449 RepID=UPI00035C8C2C|nr:TetR family transcriptional regulator [Embleya scabrispora]MYS81666.1 TetR family transcriptional regulator [Streptomyces sp. SID5474]